MQANRENAMVVTPQQLGRRIRAARGRLEISQTELAKRLKLPGRTAVARIEAGRRTMRADELAAAAALFGVGTDHLLDPLHLEGEATIEWTSAEEASKSPEIRAAVTRQAEHIVAAYRWLCGRVQDSSKPPALLTPLRYHLRLPLSSEAPEKTVARAAVHLIRQMHDNWDGSGYGRYGWPGGLIECYFGIRVLLLAEDAPLWTGRCVLPEFDAIVLSGAFRFREPGENAVDDMLHAELYRLLVPGQRWDTPALSGRFVEQMAHATRPPPSAQQSWAPPGRSFSQALTRALAEKAITQEQAVAAHPYARDEDALQAFARAHVHLDTRKNTHE